MYLLIRYCSETQCYWNTSTLVYYSVYSCYLYKAVVIIVIVIVIKRKQSNEWQKGTKIRESLWTNVQYETFSLGRLLSRLLTVSILVEFPRLLSSTRNGISLICWLCCWKFEWPFGAGVNNIRFVSIIHPGSVTSFCWSHGCLMCLKAGQKHGQRIINPSNVIFSILSLSFTDVTGIFNRWWTK